MRRLTATLAFLVAMGALAPAEAQRLTEVIQSPDGATGSRTVQGDRGPLRIQVSYQLQETVDRGAPLDAQRDALLAAHSRLFRMAGQECEAITPAFGGDCRMVSLNVANNAQSFGQNPLAIYNASAVFEVAPTPAPPKPH